MARILTAKYTSHSRNIHDKNARHDHFEDVVGIPFETKNKTKS